MEGLGFLHWLYEPGLHNPLVSAEVQYAAIRPWLDMMKDVLDKNAVLLEYLEFDCCLKFKTDQAQEAKKMEKLNNIFFTLMARGPDVDMSEVTGKEQIESQPAKKGRGRKQ
ncbi:hypothetical protein PTKIN_Ptkin15bG0113000 [Pterospermum kingtungense]